MSIFYQNRRERFRSFLSDDNTSPPHLHRQAELILTLEGGLRAAVDHQKRNLTPGCGAIVFPNRLHSLRTTDKSRILLCIFDGAFCPGYRPVLEQKQPESPFFNLEELSPHGRVAVQGLVALAGKTCRPKTGTTPETPQNPALSEGYLTLLLACLFEKMPLREKDACSDIELEQRILLYLDSHFAEALTLEALAREFGVSRFMLSRLFSDRLCTSFPDYVNTKRVAAATELLASTGLSVTQIALESGFGSARSFFREFKRCTGTTPAAYRQSCAQTGP